MSISCINTGSISEKGQRLDKKTGNLRIYSVIFALLCAAMIVPVLVFAGYSLNSIDDFGDAADMRQYLSSYGSLFAGACAYTAELYKTTSGYFFAAFTKLYIQPYLRWGLTGLRACNILINVLFFLSAFCMIHSFSKNILKKHGLFIWLLYFLFVFAIINNTWNCEIYTWFCVMTGYILSTSMMMLSLALLFYDIGNAGKSYRFIPAAVMAFFVSGVSLNVAALNCGIFFLAAAYGVLCCKKKKEGITVFVSALAGGIINLVSPGNYARHEMVTDGYNVSGAVKNTIAVTGRLLFNKLVSSPFLMIAVLAFVITFAAVDTKNLKMKFSHPFIALFIVAAGVFIVNFPVVFGYSTGYFPDRCIFVNDLALYLLLYLWIVYAAGYIREKYPDINASPASIFSAVTACVFFLILFCNVNGGLDALPTGRMIHVIGNGELKEYVAFEQDILTEIQESEDDDVVIVREEGRYMPFIMAPGITEDPYSTTNIAISKFYNKNSVVIKYGGTDDVISD